MRKLWFIGVVSLLLVACAGNNRKNQQQAEQNSTTVEVRNNNYLDMTIYLLRGGQRFRLGFVNGSSTKTFPIPNYMISGSTFLRFLANPVGSRRNPISQDISIYEGDQVRLTIPAY